MFLVVRREQALRHDLCSRGVKYRLQLDSRFAWGRRSWRSGGRLVAIRQQGDTFHLVINVDIGRHNGSSGWRFPSYENTRLWLDTSGVREGRLLTLTWCPHSTHLILTTFLCPRRCGQAC